MIILTQSIEYWRAGGYLLIPIAAVCFGVWFYFLKTRNEMLAALHDNTGIEEELLEYMQEDDYRAISRRYESEPGLFSNAVSASLRGGGNPLHSFESYEKQCVQYLKRNIVLLAGLTAAAPLLGLLGTVLGMIKTFTGMLATGETIDFIAGGISQALITTQVGLVVAIPGVFGTVRLQRLLNTVKVRWTSCRMHLSFALTATDLCSGGEG